MRWQVQIETASPDDGIDIKEMVDGSVRLLGADTTTASVNDDGWTMRFEIEAHDPWEALGFAAIRTLMAAELTFLPLWRVVAIRVLDAEFTSDSWLGGCNFIS
jgi:hypothetical protein